MRLDQWVFVCYRQMVSRVVVELFLTAPVDALAEDLPKMMEIITNLGENDGKYVFFTFFIFTFLLFFFSFLFT